jgi:hypothetical protein
MARAGTVRAMPASPFPRARSAPLHASLLALALLAGAVPLGSVHAAAPRVTLLRYSAPVPAAWQPQPPTSQFRLAQFRVPAAPGAADAELVVFHFGAGQGGSAAANIARWSSQFTGADGATVQPKVESLRVGGLPATLAEFHGTYARALAGVPAAPRAGQTLLAAIVEAPEGNVIFQLHGDRATVQANRAAFLAMLQGWSP